MRAAKLLPALATVTLAAALLSGCSLIAGPKAVIEAAQSKAAACKAISKELMNASTEFVNIGATMASDPVGSIDKISALADELNDAAAKLENPGVKKAALKAATSLATIADGLKSLETDPSAENQAKVRDEIPAMQADFTAIDTSCK